MFESIIKLAILIRQTEQRLLSLFSQGKLFGTVHTCIGQELTGATLSQFLRSTDFIFSNHRCHGHFIAITDQDEKLIAEIMGKSTGVCGGWGGSQHLCFGHFFSNGIQGGFVPIVAGLGLAIKQEQQEQQNRQQKTQQTRTPPNLSMVSNLNQYQYNQHKNM